MASESQAQQKLGQMAESEIAYVASFLHRRPDRAALPDCFTQTRAPSLQIFKPFNAHVHCLDRAHAARSCVTYVSRDFELRELFRCETKELDDSAQGVAGARKLAVTLLMGGSSNTNHCKLLDALAHVATTNSAAASVRVSLIAPELAQLYVSDHPTTNVCSAARSKFISTRSNSSEVVVSTPTELAFATLAFCETAADYVIALSKAVANCLEKIAETSSRFADHDEIMAFFSTDCEDDPNGAFCRAITDTNQRFWKLLYRQQDPKIATLDDGATIATLDFSDTFLRMIPKHCAQGPDGPGVYFGMLLFQSGLQNRTSEFVERVRSEQCKETDLPVYGLRPPTPAENVMRLHVLLCKPGHADLSPHLSRYAQEQPGARLPFQDAQCVATVDSCIRPLDEWITNCAFVCPCQQADAVNVTPEHHVPFWQTMRTMVVAFAEFMQGTPEEIEKRLKAVAKASAAATGRRPPVLTDAQKATQALLGMPFSAPNVGLGVVYDHVVRVQGQKAPFAAFLRASIECAPTGVNELVADAFERATKRLRAPADASEPSSLANSGGPVPTRLSKRAIDRTLTALGLRFGKRKAVSVPLRADDFKTLVLNAMHAANSYRSEPMPDDVLKKAAIGLYKAELASDLVDVDALPAMRKIATAVMGSVPPEERIDEMFFLLNDTVYSTSGEPKLSYLLTVEKPRFFHLNTDTREQWRIVKREA